MKFEITLEDVNRVLAYLGTCPYANVHQLFALLTQLKKIEDKPCPQPALKKEGA